jgi:hypothetical protein
VKEGERERKKNKDLCTCWRHIFREKKLHIDANGERYRLKNFFLFILCTAKKESSVRDEEHIRLCTQRRRRRFYVFYTYVKALFSVSPTIAFLSLLVKQKYVLFNGFHLYSACVKKSSLFVGRRIFLMVRA